MERALLEVDAGASLADALIARAQKGDGDAFDLLARRKVDGLYRTALAILCSESDARDATQEALVAAWRELPRLRDLRRFDAWLTRILVNSCRTLLRARKRVGARETELTEVYASRAHSAGDLVERTVGTDAIRRAFLRLDTAPRSLLVLHHVEARPLAEIALILGIPVGTVKWRLHSARRQLERALEVELR
jgi:RNA polymerase sigma-70 factor (ECF subfamily)